MSVPSFSSFPDFDTGPSEPKPPLTSNHDKNSRSRHSSKKAGRDGDIKREKRQRKLNSESKHQGAEDDSTDDTQRFFFSDRRPDILNIEYGGLHAGDIPKYRLVAGGRNILGLHNSLIVTRRAGKSIEIGFKSQRKLTSFTDSHARAMLAAPPTRLLLKKTENQKYDEVDGFIRLPSRRGKTTPENSYRSITQSRTVEFTDSESSNSDSSQDEGDDEDDNSLYWEGHESPETLQQAHLRKLEQELSANPHCVQKWLSLLDHTLSSVPLTSKNAAKARCDITISVLSRSLSAHPQNRSSETLRIKFLRAGEEIWHESRLRVEWEDALKVGGVEIWLEWLEWRLRRVRKGVGGLIDDVSRAMNGLGDEKDGEFEKIRVFWRTAVVLKNAGFPERAMAMFQAQLELSFNIPTALTSAPLQTLLDELEQFWESESIRIGEEAAKGWRAWYDSGKPERHNSPTLVSAPTEILDLDPYRQWAAQEAVADKKSLLPCRPASDLEVDLDPYSTILFGDIRPTMFILRTVRAKQAFRLAFLCFLGLHIPGFSISLSAGRDTNWDDRWSMGHLVEPLYLQAIFPDDAKQGHLISDAVAGTVVGREKEYSITYGPVKSWGYGVFHPLDIAVTDPLQKTPPRQRLWSKLESVNINGNIVRCVFPQLRMGPDDFEWDSFALAFEAVTNPKSAMKLSKTFLSEKRESLNYWGAHAQLERIYGQLDGARKIYQTVLISAKRSSLLPGVSQLWWNWAEMEWLAKQYDQAANIVLCSVGINGPRTSMTVLRAKRIIEDHISSTFQLKDREAWINLRALLELLEGEGVDGVVTIFETNLTTEHRSLARESLTVVCLLFLYHHSAILKNAMAPALLRDRARRGLDEYPSNSVILSIFLEGEKGQGIWGKVRGMLGAGDGMAKDVARRVEEVWIAGWEKGRWLGEVERTRNGLAAAVEHERTKASPIIWRVWIEFEIRTGNLRNAKRLLFRAIGECPSVKELYLLAFGPLRSVFDARELHGFADTMAERGLRLRKGLDEVVGIEDGGHEREKNDNEEMEDEIEQNARELRRLMPF